MENLGITEKSRPERQSETPDDFFEEVLCTSPVIASGRDGIVLKIDISDFDEQTIKMMADSGIDISPRNGYALKMLKIYRPGYGEREYNIQKSAYEILKDLDAVAKVPKPIVMRVQRLNEADKQYLKNHAPFIEDDAELILMDYIEGVDLADYIYDFILSKNGYEEAIRSNMSFEQKHSAVNDLLGFEKPGNATPGNFGDIMAMRDNVRKLMNYLKKSGFHIDREVLEKIKNAIRILESNRIFHNDLHERNVMIDKDGQPYIIDFGRSVENKNDQESDDLAIVRRYEDLNKKQDNDYVKYWVELTNKVSESEKWREVCKKWKESMENKKGNIILNDLIMFSTDENQFLRSLAVLAFLSVELKSKDSILKIIDDFDLTLKIGHRKAKLKEFRNYILTDM